MGERIGKEKEEMEERAEEQDRTNIATSSARCCNHGRVMYVQWELSVLDTLKIESVPNREVSSFQGSKCTQS